MMISQNKFITKEVIHGTQRQLPGTDCTKRPVLEKPYRNMAGKWPVPGRVLLATQSKSLLPGLLEKVIRTKESRSLDIRLVVVLPF